MHDQVIRGLEEAGQERPEGRLHHVSGSTDGGWRVVDVWESREQFERFGQTLMPWLREAGFPELAPQFWPAYNVVAG